MKREIEKRNFMAVLCKDKIHGNVYYVYSYQPRGYKLIVGMATSLTFTINTKEETMILISYLHDLKEIIEECQKQLLGF